MAKYPPRCGSGTGMHACMQQLDDASVSARIAGYECTQISSVLYAELGILESVA